MHKNDFKCWSKNVIKQGQYDLCYVFILLKKILLLGEIEYLSMPEPPRQHQFILLSTSIDHALKHSGLSSPGALISAQIHSDTEALATLPLHRNPSGLESIRQFTASSLTLRPHFRLLNVKLVGLIASVVSYKDWIQLLASPPRKFKPLLEKGFKLKVRCICWAVSNEGQMHLLWGRAELLMSALIPLLNRGLQVC